MRRLLGAACLAALLAVVLLLFVAPKVSGHDYDWYSGSATAYAVCDGSTSLQANGTRIRYGEVANNWLALGTLGRGHPAPVGAAVARPAVLSC